MISRVPSADVNDDGVANTADVTRLQASLGRSCGQPGFNPNADVNNDCNVNALDLEFVARATSAFPSHASRGSRRAPRWRSIR